MSLRPLRDQKKTACLVLQNTKQSSVGQASPGLQNPRRKEETIPHVDIVSSERLTVQEIHLQSPFSIHECTSWKMSVVEGKLKQTWEHSLCSQTRNKAVAEATHKT